MKTNKMSGSWSTKETKTLISICDNERVQSRLDSVHRNWHIFEQITREMSENAITRHGSSAERK